MSPNRAGINSEKTQVLLWSVNDVASWIETNKFEQYKQEFLNCQVDGDLLLQLDEKSLKEDIGMINGIHRKRFMRLLNELKCSTDYSSKDKTGLYDFLKSLGAEYCQYTYQMLLNGVHTDDLKDMSCKQLELVCGISNSIHRDKILHKAKYESYLPYSLQIRRHQIPKSYDVFISYRRSNGSHLASFLYYYLSKQGFSVFLDVVTLGKGRFEPKTLHNIQIAKNFLLLLTTDALDRCKGDETRQDWLHKEIVGALNSKCNIIPILDKFEWPDSSELPKDMQLIYLYNAVEWHHDNLFASLYKIKLFIDMETHISLGTNSDSSSVSLN